jgi:putative SOS response-associated peptidase YedK
MCYDISFTTTVEKITDLFPETAADAEQLSFSFEPTDHVLAHSFRKHPVVLFENGAYKLRMFEWGVIADYMDSPEKARKLRNMMCNARSEKILDDKKSYWHRIRHQRCLVPVTGIFEHREVRGWKTKIPYHVQLKEQTLFCIPGLYNYSPLPDPETGEVRGTFSLITRAANTVMQQIHNCGENAFRMPLFLPKDYEKQWVQPRLSDNELSSVLNFELKPGALDYYPVYTIRTTKPRPDNKPKTAPYEWPGLPPLGQDEAPTGVQTALF